jgi:hypothetical protein
LALLLSSDEMSWELEEAGYVVRRNFKVVESFRVAVCEDLLESLEIVFDARCAIVAVVH